MNGRTPMIAGNWKMNLNVREAVSLVKAVAEAMAGAENVEVLVAPPFTLLAAVRETLQGTGIYLGAQNMHWEKGGAYTGEICPAMLLEAGCSHVILGHSERRSLFGETSDMVNRKAAAAVLAGLIPIVCIGETLQERERGRTFEVVSVQLEESLRSFRGEQAMPRSTLLAYEPVWAIGTGRTATPQQAQEVHGFVRQWMAKALGGETAERVRILYGGSVKPDNIADLMAMPDIDGALVGGASLKAESFVPIVRYRRA
ncbi:MAG: triose-phosphate isomerase [Thermodesulfobacteriota bacterium]